MSTFVESSLTWYCCKALKGVLNIDLTMLHVILRSSFNFVVENSYQTLQVFCI